MENALLQQILKNQELMFNEFKTVHSRLENMEADIKELKQGQARLEVRIDSLEKTVNATFEQTVKLTEFQTEANHKFDKIKSVL